MKRAGYRFSGVQASTYFEAIRSATMSNRMCPDCQLDGGAKHLISVMAKQPARALRRKTT